MSTIISPADGADVDTIVAKLRQTILHDEDEDLVRSAQVAKLQLAEEFIKAELYEEALRLLRPLWHGMTWRREGWWDLVEQVDVLLRKVAVQLADASTVIAIDWELLSSVFSPDLERTRDLAKALDSIETTKGKPTVIVRQSETQSFLSAAFAFSHSEGKVGEPCVCQLSITSNAARDTAPIVLSDVKIQFDGSLRPVILGHKSDSAEGQLSRTKLTQLSMREDRRASLGGRQTPMFMADCDLTFAPGQTKVFEFTCPLREPGKASALLATFSLSVAQFDVEYLVDFDNVLKADTWWTDKSKRRIVRASPHVLDVLPKPPKMDIRFKELQSQYYTDETIDINMDIFNGEDEESVATLSVEIESSNPVAALGYTIETPSSSEEATEPTSNESGAKSLPTPLGTIRPLQSLSAVLKLESSPFDITHDITLKIRYHLVSDPQTPIYRTNALKIHVIPPFEANYDFSPRIDPRPWPSFFDPLAFPASKPAEGQDNHDAKRLSTSSIPADAVGLPQKWALTALFTSFGKSILNVTKVDVQTVTLNGGITCTTSLSTTQPPLLGPIEPAAEMPAAFDVLTQKISLDDRRSSSLDLKLLITWKRNALSAPEYTSTLPIPRLLITSEPRVLSFCSVLPANPALGIPSPLAQLTYEIENPSMHFLTFSLVMEPSEKFAFSGPKSAAVNLLPLSRRRVEFKLLPSVSGEWIYPRLVVTDRYFQKVLKASPGEGMRTGADGAVGVWIPVEEED